MIRINCAFLSLSLAFISTFAVAAPVQKVKPRFVRTSLAGSELKDEISARYDAKEKYFLISRPDAVGRLIRVRLLLCPDPKQFYFYPQSLYPGYGNTLRDVQPTQFPHLRTGWGVNIGDSPAQVRHKLGAPQERYLSKTKTRLYVYRAEKVAPIVVNGREVIWDYVGKYTFRNERLWAIDYTATNPSAKYD